MDACTKSFQKTKYACYYTYLAMSSVFCLPPILFVTFREMYGISYTLLGTLVLVNFLTQLAIDLVFTFFSRYFNIRNTIRIMPLLTSAGLLIYAFIPMIISQHAYAGLLAGTVVFSVASGLCEVLLSPLIAALPSDNTERDMSTLHSLYAWGVVSVIIISTVFLGIFGTKNWMYLTIILALLPVVSFVLFCNSPMPETDITHSVSRRRDKKKNLGILLFMLCIFLGSSAENAMTSWISVYMESALHIPKTYGDIFGMALFAVLLGLGRTLYARFGKNIFNVMLFGMIGAVICYITAGISSVPLVCAFACVLTGLCTSMLWPGTLIFMEEKFPNPGITAYALMAAGGDLGGSVAPQILGAVVDTVSQSSQGTKLGEMLSLSSEQIGIKAGMLTAALYPILGVVLLLIIKKKLNKS